MDFTQFRSFQAVALAGSFTGAAERLSISQPTVTRQVRELEERYGVELFHRRGRRVELSDVGKSLLAITERVFTTSDEAAELLETAGRLETGHLRVSAVSPFDIVHVVCAFARKFPKIRVSLNICNTHDAIDSLQEFRADVAMVASKGMDSRFHYVDFGSRPLVVYVYRDHPWSRRKRIRLKELNGESLIIRELGSVTRHLLESACARAGVAPDIGMEINNRDAFREAIARGLGIGVMSDRGLVPDDRLRSIALGDENIYLERWLACLHDRRDARLIKAFMQIGGLVAEEIA